jgi:hypothetical protein
MHCNIMPFAHIWLISPIGHVYAEPELEVPIEQVQVEDSTNLDFESRQALVHLTTVLEFILIFVYLNYDS